MNPREQRRYLRARTHAVHAALEELPLLRRLMSPQVQPEDYRLVLRAFYRAYLPLCEHLRRSLGPWAHAQLAPQQLVALLREDVRHLPGDLPEPLAAACLPALATADEALGAWYVLEGSAMGGVIVARHLQRCLQGELPMAYMARRKSDSDQRWRQFEAHFMECLSSGARIEAVIRGAEAAYALTAHSVQAL